MGKKDIIYGLRPVSEALSSGKDLEKVLIQKGLRGKFYGELWQLIKQYDLPYQFVPQEKLNALTGGNHQGILAFLSPVEYQDITALLPMLFEEGKIPFLLVLDRITDVRNFGAIVRTASCAGVDAVIIPAKGAARINADAVKTSAGALHIMPVCRSNQFTDTLKFLKDSGIRLVAGTEKARVLYDQQNYLDPLALVMGSEEDGVSPEVLKLCDESVALPMQGDIGSLNVSVAAGILMYEVLRQRKSREE